MFVSWRGQGWIIPAGTLVLGLLISLPLDSATRLNRQLAIAGMFIVLAIPIWFYGRKINQHPSGVATGVHRFMWIPFEYWALIYPIIAIVMMLAAK